jgi:hypothetical protein
VRHSAVTAHHLAVGASHENLMRPLSNTLLALCAAVLPLCASAQESINYASLAGRVTDPQGASIAGAEVTARHTGTNVKASAVTEQDGRFRFPFLKVGSYDVDVRAPGFKAFTRPLTLNMGAAFQVPITLEVGGLEERVTVTGDAGTIETARSQIAGTISSAEVGGLPMNGRNFLDLALLVPGVSPTNTASTQLFAETSAVPGQGLSVASQRNFSNSFIVDGVSANDDAAGLSGLPLAVEAVDQFQVVTSGGQAELGRALGGYVNVVTRSGTNVLHGSVYEFLRDDAFNAANPLLGRTLPMRQHQYGLSMGGPVVRDRTFFFANVEQRDLSQSGLTTISDASVATINARLAATGYAGSPVATGVYPNPVHSTLGLAKLDHQAGAHQMSLRYSLYLVNADNSRGAGGLGAPSGSAGLDNSDHAVAFSDTWALSSRTVNETRVQFTRGDLQALPTDPIGPAVSISGIAAFGTLSSSPTRRVNKLFEIVDTVSHQAGPHALRAGRGFPLQRRHHHLSALGARRVHVLVAGQLPGRHLQQRRLHADVRRSPGGADQPQRRALRAGRMACRVPAHRERGAALRPAAAGDGGDGRRQRLPARRIRVDALGLAPHGDPRRGRALLRPRPPCARWPTRSSPPATAPTSRGCSRST